MIDILHNIIKEQAEHINGVKFFKYEGNDLINQQHNNETIQIWMEDNIYTEYIVSKDLIKVEINIDILDKLDNDKTKLSIHNNTFKIGIILLKLIESKYKGIINIYDYSLMNISQFTDDNLFGTRMTVYMHIPSPINECNINDYINELNKYYYNESNDIEIIYPKINIDNININPIKLKK